MSKKSTIAANSPKTAHRGKRSSHYSM